jgi:signal peptidase complex subunit 1
MDFEGQKNAERLLMVLTMLFATVGFLAGYISSDFKLMAIINAAGVVVTLLAVVPNWPWFNRNKLPWLPPLEGKAAKRD